MKAQGWRTFSFSFAIALAGCGGDDGGPSSPQPDAPPVGVSVPLTMSGEPVVFAYRDEDATEWQDIPLSPDDVYLLRVHGPFEVLALCGEPGDYQLSVKLATPADDDLSMFCFSSGGSTQPGPEKTLTGTMAQPGSVSIDGRSDQGNTGPWSFEIAVPEDATTGDLFAYNTARVLVRRELDLAAAIAPVDLADGMDFMTRGVIVDGPEADEELMTDMFYFTAGGSMSLSAAGTTIRSMPDALTQPTDFDYAYVSATSPQTYRFHVVESEDRIQLLPRLSGMTFDGTSVTWGALPAGGFELELTLYAGASSVNVSAEPGWYTGRTTLALPADLPELPDGALPKVSDILYRSASVSSSDGRAFSSYSPVANLPLRRLEAARQRRVATATARHGGPSR
ncbi:MAG TPA: hypothetical protein VM513_23690 [Kofleriaceae bacterium]|jgi:hypothetical protein|nr:hypothetical protein [Kofleriaceae bacterium]